LSKTRFPQNGPIIFEGGRIPAKVNFRLTASRRGNCGPVGRVLAHHKNQGAAFYIKQQLP
jgi:hypothetical protein